MKNILKERPGKTLNDRLKASFNFVSKEDLTNKTILDVGCGYGWFELNALDYEPKEIHACEISEKDLETIKDNVKNSKVKLSIASAIDLNFEENKFDTVVSWEVIEHIPKNEENKFFFEVNKILKDRGSFYISTPYDSFLSKFLDPGWYLVGHRHYSIKKLSEFAENNGFVIEKIRVYGSFWLLLDILNMYVSKWIFKRPRFFKKLFNIKVDKEFQIDGGFMNIFVKFRKNEKKN